MELEVDKEGARVTKEFLKDFQQVEAMKEALDDVPMYMRVMAAMKSLSDKLEEGLNDIEDAIIVQKTILRHS